MPGAGRISKRGEISRGIGFGLARGLSHTLTPDKGGGAFTPLSLGAAVVAWWTADDAASFTLSGAAVTQWRDQKAGYVASQGLSSSRPTYGATLFNGAPGVNFDGTDDELTSTTAGLLAALPTGTSECYLAAIVEQQRLASNGTRNIIAGYGGASSLSRRAVERSVTSGVNTASVTVGNGAATVSRDYVALPTFDSRHYVIARASAAEIGINIDGGTEETVSAVPATSADRFRIGAISNTSASNFFDGVARDIIVLSGPTPAQLAQLSEWALSRRML